MVILDGRVYNHGTWAQASIDVNGAMWESLSFLQGSGDGGDSITVPDESGQHAGASLMY